MTPSPDPSAKQPHAEPPGRVAAIDYGTVRIGVAITDRNRTLASPHSVYARRSPAADAAFFQQLAREDRVTLFVVGLPVHLNGHESQKSHEARQFAQWLEQITSVPVQLFDERFTTVEAESLLQGAELTSRRRKARRDMLAAQILLSAWLESPRATPSPTRLDDR